LYILATCGHTKFDFFNDVANIIIDEILEISQEVDYPKQNKIERFGTNNPYVQTVNGCWPWVMEVLLGDAICNNLFNIILIYENYYEEEEPSYDDSKNRLDTKLVTIAFACFFISGKIWTYR
jgi:hypothetical protein